MRIPLGCLLLFCGCIVGPDQESEPEPGSLAATWGVYDPQPGHPTLAERDAYVADISQYAQEAEATYGTPAAAITAMASNECGFGFTRIALYANNLFGFKWTSYEQAGGRGYYVLENQPASDPGNKYIKFADRRDAVLYVGQRLGTTTRYKPATDRYQSDLANGVDVKPAADRWIAAIAAAGYNPYAHYPTTTINFMNNYRSPSSTVSAAYNLYKYSRINPWISIDSPTANGVVSGDATISSSVGGAAITSVKFGTRAVGATDWYELGEDTAAPFTKTWATDPWVQNGSYEIKVEAYTGGMVMATGIRTVTVAN
jgi:hypothetical protein